VFIVYNVTQSQRKNYIYIYNFGLEHRIKDYTQFGGRRDPHGVGMVRWTNFDITGYFFAMGVIASVIFYYICRV
jgi:hypothetical protein